jgi:hypothetical protein
VLLLPEGQDTKPGNLPNSNAVSEIREHEIEEYSGFLKRSIFLPRDLVVTLCDRVKKKHDHFSGLRVINRQDRQNTCNITFRPFLLAIVAVEKQ